MELPDSTGCSPAPSSAGQCASSRGRLKVFLGFAAGVGKTYEMLSEANRRKLRGQDVIVGYVETHGRRGTEEQIGQLEVIPRSRISYRGAEFEEMDSDAIIRRKPQWVLVDELAHTNLPGGLREKRWQDVEAILAAGINVETTMNVQHLESLNDTVFDITGVRIRETVPDRIVHEADEIKMVDITPRALIHRLERGDIYRREKVQQALNNWFQEGNLNALREIALREIAHEVDEDASTYLKEHHQGSSWPTNERIMLCIAPQKPCMRLIRRGWRIAQRLKAEITAVYVENRRLSSAESAYLKSDLALCERLSIPVVTLHGQTADELIRFATDRRITQLLVGHSSHPRGWQLLRGSTVSRLTRALRSVDILLVAAPNPDPKS